MKSIRQLAIPLAMAALLFAGCAPTATQRAPGQFVDDATITAKVKTALIKNNDVNANAINVNTFRGVVQLSGFVDSQQMAERAAAEARRVGGVQRVENDIKVAPPR